MFGEGILDEEQNGTTLAHASPAWGPTASSRLHAARAGHRRVPGGQRDAAAGPATPDPEASPTRAIGNLSLTILTGQEIDFANA
jgi:hypothetical protein